MTSKQRIIAGFLDTGPHLLARTAHNDHLRKAYKWFAGKLTKPKKTFLRFKNDIWFLGPKLRLFLSQRARNRRATRNIPLFKRKYGMHSFSMS